MGTKGFLCLGLFILIINSSWGGEGLKTQAERKSYSVGEYAKAVEKAKKRNKILGIIAAGSFVRHRETGDTADLTDTLYGHFKSKVVVIFADSSYSRELPPKVKNAIDGNYRKGAKPFLVLYDPEKDKVVSFMMCTPYRKALSSKALKRVKQDLKDYYKAAKADKH